MCGPLNCPRPPEILDTDHPGPPSIRYTIIHPSIILDPGCYLLNYFRQPEALPRILPLTPKPGILDINPSLLWIMDINPPSSKTIEDIMYQTLNHSRPPGTSEELYHL